MIKNMTADNIIQDKMSEIRKIVVPCSAVSPRNDIKKSVVALRSRSADMLLSIPGFAEEINEVKTAAIKHNEIMII